MPLQATSGAASYDGFGGGVAVVPTFIEDVFSCFLYTGNDSSQTITNGVNLSANGGLVWIKARTATYSHILSDTVRGTGKFLSSNTTDAQGTDAQDVTAFNTTGFTVGNNSRVNNSSFTYASWTFRKQPKFFDVVTYTGNGANRTIAHNLGSAPGCMIIKKTNAAKDWAVYHRSTGNTKYLTLNSTAAQATSSSYWNNTDPTSTVFTVGIDGDVNANGDTYIAYLFAHDAGGFGLTGSDNVVSCGSYTGNGSTSGPTVTLGYEPQWVMIKSATAATYNNWFMFDTMRGISYGSGDAYLYANLSNAETTGGEFLDLTATGFNLTKENVCNESGVTYIYIAIRRGPMKVPTTGTSVFIPIVNSNTTGATNTTGFPVDTQIWNLTGGYQGTVQDRLRGVSTTTTQTSCPELLTPYTSAEASNAFQVRNWNNTGFQTPTAVSGARTIWWNFGRAPSFFDVVCYTGTGSARTVSHNLAAVPEMAIFKNRTSVAGARNWIVCNKDLGGTNKYLYLNLDAAVLTAPNIWDTPTASVFSLSTYAEYNENTYPIVAYLFATCAGVSKVGSYTGTAAAQTINCGFTAGARFVLIKRTDSTGDWYVWDSARGMVSGTDPSLLLNSTAAEVNANSVYAISTGFQIVSTAAGINASGGSYIFLSVA